MPYLGINIVSPLFFPLTDVDECEMIPGLCGPGGVCKNTIASYTCTHSPHVECPTGYMFDLTLQSCLGLFAGFVDCVCVIVLREALFCAYC